MVRRLGLWREITRYFRATLEPWSHTRVWTNLTTELLFHVSTFIHSFTTAASQHLNSNSASSPPHTYIAISPHRNAHPIKPVIPISIHHHPKPPKTTTMAGALIKFLQLKRYQYEVTFSLYMLTPVEKIIFNTLLFIFLSLLITAVSFYLPHHVAIIAKRAWYYYAGDSTVLDTRALEGLKEL
ncbi:hypothetical protein BZA77DRAFT_126848 [Pyronema omphalodes]|nr:hypothetical protein BZA77DRAFT_126848 [Pyronema omphalodes]